MIKNTTVIYIKPAQSNKIKALLSKNNQPV